MACKASIFWSKYPTVSESGHYYWQIYLAVNVSRYLVKKSWYHLPFLSVLGLSSAIFFKKIIFNNCASSGKNNIFILFFVLFLKYFLVKKCIFKVLSNLLHEFLNLTFQHFTPLWSGKFVSVTCIVYMDQLSSRIFVLFQKFKDFLTRKRRISQKCMKNNENIKWQD